ncbi:MAG: hypothetical protein E6638_07600 [Clostridium perfringens]|nr:hypothetical protein [Clostridium perfringens]MDU6174991.1 hypothetical protein [Clostridium perfringens]
MKLLLGRKSKGYLENRLLRIEEDIKNANINIDYYQNGIGISERV